MPKIIIDNFLGGISPSDRFGPEGSYNLGAQIDPHRVLGYLSVGLAPAVLARSDDAVPIVTDLIMDIETYITASVHKGYGVGSGGKFYEMTVQSGSEAVTNAGNFPHAIAAHAGHSGVVGESVIVYPCKIAGTLTNMVFYSWNDNVDGDIGSMAAGGAGADLDDDWGSTIPASGAVLTLVPHPMIEGPDGILYILNGANLASLDGQTGANGTFNASALNIPSGWVMHCIGKISNYLVIGASKSIYGASDTYYRTISGLFLWDMVSSSFNEFIPVEDNRITSMLNKDGNVYLTTQGRGTFGASGSSLRVLNGNKVDKIIDIAVGTTNYNAPNVNAIDIFRNQIVFGENSMGLIFSYGKPIEGLPDAFTQPWRTGNMTNIGCVKAMQGGSLWVSSYHNGVYYLITLSSGFETNASYRSLFYEFPQTARINYVKVYCAGLGANATVTIGIQTKYGAVTTELGTLSHAVDGGAECKKFTKIIEGIHNFRVYTTSYGATNAPQITRFVIDYDLVNDK